MSLKKRKVVSRERGATQHPYVQTYLTAKGEKGSFKEQPKSGMNEQLDSI